MLLKKANTITTPTAYSNGFLHSVKPEVVENLLVQSNQFDTTWSTNGTLTSGQSGYDGSNDAWLFNYTADPLIAYVPNTNSGVQTISLYAKGSVNNGLRIYAFGSVNCNAFFDLNIGSVEFTGNVINATIEDKGNGWYRCLMTFNQTNSSINFYLSNNANLNATSGSIYIQDAQLNKGATAYPYLETTTEAKPSADFSFSRNSSATRVNELGYIEDVQIIGGELVSNGDFEEIGSELITNGSFDTDSDWVKGTGWSISGGKARSTTSASSTYLVQANVLTASKTYKIIFTVSDYVSGTVRAGVSGQEGASITANGTYTEYLTTNGTNFSIKSQGGSFIGSIDNVSVKEVGQNWTFGTGWSIAEVNGSQVAISDGTQSNSNLSRSNILTLGAKYRASFDVVLNSGILNAYITSAITKSITSSGSYTIEAISDRTDLDFHLKCVNFDGYVDNISVKEVTDDTNLPRINYEGFTYENGLPVPYSGKGHLLLEGQRTNLVGYSEDFTNAYWSSTTDVILEGGYLAPDGSNNAYKVTKNGSSAKVAVVVVGTAPYSKSIYARTLNGTGTAYFGEGQISGNGVLSTVTEQWQRFEISVVDNNFYAVDFRGASTLTEVLIWGAQMENNATYATSYIPTNGTAVTRLGETCNNATQSFPSSGTLYAEIAALADDNTNRLISITDGTLNNRVTFGFTTLSNRILYQVYSGGVSQVNTNTTITDITLYNKIAIRYKENDFSAWQNGVQVLTDTSGVVPSGLSELMFHYGNNSYPLYGKTKMVATFPYLSNDEMECLTGEGYGTFEALAAAYSYTIK